MTVSDTLRPVLSAHWTSADGRTAYVAVSDQYGERIGIIGQVTRNAVTGDYFGRPCESGCWAYGPKPTQVAVMDALWRIFLGSPFRGRLDKVMSDHARGLTTRTERDAEAAEIFRAYAELKATRVWRAITEAPTD